MNMEVMKLHREGFNKNVILLLPYVCITEDLLLLIMQASVFWCTECSALFLSHFSVYVCASHLYVF